MKVGTGAKKKKGSTGEEERREANAGKCFLFPPPLPLLTVLFSLVQGFLDAGILTARVLSQG